MDTVKVLPGLNLQHQYDWSGIYRQRLVRRLEWIVCLTFSDVNVFWQALELISNCVHLAQNVLSDVDLKVFIHNAYGKGLMKKCKVSPDAYLQMALQLAYFRVCWTLMA